MYNHYREVETLNLLLVSIDLLSYCSSIIQNKFGRGQRGLQDYIRYNIELPSQFVDITILDQLQFLFRSIINNLYPKKVLSFTKRLELIFIEKFYLKYIYLTLVFQRVGYKDIIYIENQDKLVIYKQIVTFQNQI